MDIKKKYGRYGVQEWVTLLFGVGGLGVQLFRYATDGLGEWPMEVFVFCAATMLVTSPLTILDIIRKARGIEPKADKLKE